MLIKGKKDYLHMLLSTFSLTSNQVFPQKGCASVCSTVEVVLKNVE